jgi:hypothetical protein
MLQVWLPFIHLLQRLRRFEMALITCKYFQQYYRHLKFIYELGFIEQQISRIVFWDMTPYASVAKGKVVPVHSMKAYRGERRYSSTHS